MAKIFFDSSENCLYAVREDGRRLYIDAGDGWCVGPIGMPTKGLEQFRGELLACKTEDELADFIDDESNRWYSELEWV